MGLPVLRQAMEKKGGLLTKDEAVEAMQQETATFHPPHADSVDYTSSNFCNCSGDVYPGIRIFSIQDPTKKELCCGSRIRCFFDPGIRDRKQVRIRDPHKHLGSYF
jgi:hypothetical protein